MLQVRCRTITELQEDISTEESRCREQDFFSSHAELRNIEEEYKGVPALSQKLVQIQDQCIQRHLPELQKEASHHCSYILLCRYTLYVVHRALGGFVTHSNHPQGLRQ